MPNIESSEEILLERVYEGEELIKASNSLYESIIVDNNYLFFNSRLAWNYRRLAELAYANGDKERAIDNLEMAYKYVKAYDELPEKSIYTSVLLKDCEYVKSEASKEWIGTECEMLRYRMEERGFEDIREMDRFKRILEEL